MRSPTAAAALPLTTFKEPTSVLVFDNDASRRLVLRQLLERAGGDYNVRDAVTTTEAVHLMATIAPGLLLVSHTCRSWSHSDMLRLLGVTPQSPWAVILFAGDSDDACPDVESLLSSGADDFVSAKSCRPAAFRWAVDSALVRARIRIQRSSQVADLREQLSFESRLIALVGHDLRTPLSSLMMSLDSLRMNQDDAQLISIAKRSAHRIRDMVSQLLDLTRIREGSSFPLVRAEVDLVPLLEHVVQEHRLTSGREISLVTKGALRGDMDESAIGQLVSNLVANALVHGDAGAPVRVEAECEGTCIVVRVLNRGAGFTAHASEDFFKPFVRGSTGDGLGLGLFIVRSIIESHHGELRVHSIGCETQFVARWPSALDPQQFEPVQPKPTALLPETQAR